MAVEGFIVQRRVVLYVMATEITGFDLCLRNVREAVEEGDELTMKITSAGSRGFSETEGERSGTVEDVGEYEIGLSGGLTLRKSGVSVVLDQEGYCSLSPDAVVVE